MEEWKPEGGRGAPRLLPRARRELVASGELVESEVLAGPDLAKIVTSDGATAPVVTDGPFQEFKEWVAGYQIVDVDSEERAIEIAAKLSAVPGPGGVRSSSRSRSAGSWTSIAVETRPRWTTYLETAGGALNTTPDVEDLLRELAPQVLGALAAGTATSTRPRTPSRRRSSPRPTTGRATAFRRTRGLAAPDRGDG